MRRPLTTSKGKGSRHNGSIQSDHSKKPRPDTKRTGGKSTLTCHAKTGYTAPLNGSNAWMGEEPPVIPKMTPQGISPLSPTYTPRGCITTTTTKTMPEHYP